ncbi:oligopeptide transport system substrate-binding protein [Ereboglobus sp. PH5-5]|uniref:peptide ABC transporter substrate-binding protein n=1 Tax=Ereboglobus sp. PH5-5 TaxID=2940529 RepID=UPI0024053B6C|nr:peptide ABC transporter substrate-binding protein [Ereboglobus sp. PH5-5]MDF9831856.1 oligopeptide transport system substrate-binding protein [Ereboglobus sp. PH5-5]
MRFLHLLALLFLSALQPFGPSALFASSSVLRIGNGAEPQDMDPQTMSAYTDQNIAIALFEGLVAIDEATSQPVPAVAESWEISPDGLTWTFRLRAGARWSNGDPVTAQDFATSFRRILSPMLGAEYAYMLYPVKNAGAFNTGKLSDFAQVGVAAPDARTLVLTLEAPTPHLLSIVAQPMWFPVHAPTILRFGKLDQRGTAWTRPENIVGNGAFTMKSWEPNRQITVEKNPLYWDAAGTRLDAVVFFPNDDIATDERNFRSGQVDITYDILPEKIRAYRKNNPAALRIDPLLETFFLRFNTKRPPLDNPKVRAALARAINRDLIARVLHNSRTPARFYTPPNTGGYTCATAIPDDFAAARRLLAEAGYPKGKGFPKLDIQMNNDAVNRTVLEAIQEMWRRELGISVTITNKEYRVYLDAQRAIGFDISRSRWVGDFNDPITFLDMFVTNGGQNQTHWSNAEYDRLIAEAGRASDREKRFELYQRAEKILLDEAPIAPIFFGTRSYLISPRVKNWVPSLLGIHRYQKVWVE